MTELTIRVLRGTSNELPAYETTHSAGLDLRAHLDEPLSLAPGARALVPSGLRLEIPVRREGADRGIGVVEEEGDDLCHLGGPDRRHQLRHDVPVDHPDLHAPS